MTLFGPETDTRASVAAARQRPVITQGISGQRQWPVSYGSTRITHTATVRPVTFTTQATSAHTGSTS